MPFDRFTLFSLLTTALLGLGCSPSASPASVRPDVVVVVVDTLRADRLSCYGYPRDTSPVIDGLAESGVLFEDNTAQWPWTLPSTVTIFQGRYLTNYRDRLDESAPSIAELFKDAGYTTIGLVANCAVDAGQGFTRGFDHYDVNECWEDDAKKVEINRDIQVLRELVSAAVKEPLGSAPAGERPPLFLYIHAYDPHSPYFGHEQYDEVLPNDQAVAVEPAGYWERVLDERGPDPPRQRQRGWMPDLERLQEQRGRYDQEVRYFDQGLGEILGDLERLGISDETVYALVSDHGEGLWDHVSNESTESLSLLRPMKFFYQLHGGNGYEPVMATPFVLWGAGIPAGERVAKPVQNIDLLPTLLTLAAIERPAGLDGRNLLETLRDDSDNPWREFAYCYGSHTISIRHAPSGYKLILPNGQRSEANDKEIELFSLLEDPYERVNLADSDVEKVAWLVKAYNAWMEANPTESTMKGAHAEKNAEGRKALAEKLKALGYTELETGLSGE